MGAEATRRETESMGIKPKGNGKEERRTEENGVDSKRNGGEWS